MGLYDKLTGKATMSNNNKYVEDFLSNDESIIASFTFLRDSITFTNKGIYFVDVQGIGKKVEVKFFPGKNVKSVTFETAGSFDLDVDIKISIDGNTVFNANGIPYNAPLSFMVPKGQGNQAREVVKIVKDLYLCK